MRAESLLSTASSPGTHHDAAAATSRKALGLLVRAAGLQVRTRQRLCGSNHVY